MAKYDVLVIGGGHAGTEAAHASARLGCRTALLTLNAARIGFMSCNPAIGGLAKGQLVKEIDALGGVMGRITDLSAIQYRRLNESKGPAVRSSRAQCDKERYSLEMRRFLPGVSGLDVVECEVERLKFADGKLSGVVLGDGSVINASAVVITSGTFLRAVMHLGESQESGGRAGDRASVGLSGALSELGFRLTRLKTGTPARLHKRSVNFSVLESQPGDVNPRPFSFYFKPERFPNLPQVPCHITHTNAQTHEIIDKNLARSPMYSGQIQGIGPRYCPSIEDKVHRFRDKDRHQIFLEPEGLDVPEIYVNGMSTSLPRDVQEAFIHSIRGLEQAEFIRYGYAVEYDAIDARQLTATLESKDVPGLFFAGQVNGTSGYEEAGAQGIVAGINAALKVCGREPFILTRMDGYIGVLVDDLILKGTDEPYRMFTSRAEYRLLQREDNADVRLSEKAHAIGLLGEREYRQFDAKRQEVARFRSALRAFHLVPSEASAEWLARRGQPALKDRVSGESLLRRPEVRWVDLVEIGFEGKGAGPEVAEQVEIQVKYEGYIERDLELLEGVRKNERLRLPVDLDYGRISGLSTEIKGRLAEVRPQTIGQASRLQGITPAAVATLVIYLKMKERGSRVSER